MRLHIHRFKTTDIHFEQPVLSIYKEHLSDGDQRLYWDYKIKKCRCGKEKKVLINMYFADEIRTRISQELTAIRLGNKKGIV